MGCGPQVSFATQIQPIFDNSCLGNCHAGRRPSADLHLGVGRSYSELVGVIAGCNDGRLLVAEDSSGWWNLMLCQPGDSDWQRPWPMAAETAMPQWIYGMSTTAWDGDGLLAAACSQGSWGS